MAQGEVAASKNTREITRAFASNAAIAAVALEPFDTDPKLQKDFGDRTSAKLVGLSLFRISAIVGLNRVHRSQVSRFDSIAFVSKGVSKCGIVCGLR